MPRSPNRGRPPRLCDVMFGIKMTVLPRTLGRLHHRVGGLGISLLMLPIVGWVWPAAREPVISVFNGNVPRYVLSGKLCSEPFNIVHAGFALDDRRSANGCFGFPSWQCHPCLTRCGWIFREQDDTRLDCLTFGIGVGVLGVFLLCILSWPLSWLVQYMRRWDSRRDELTVWCMPPLEGCW